jgi:hypothetical protein
LAELMQRDLVERGVPADAVIRFPHSAGNTRGEAEALREPVAKRGWRRVLVVTSNFHTRRARYIFRRVFPSTVSVRVVAARDSLYDPDHWWESRQGVKLFFGETLGICVAMWELRHAETPPAGAQSIPARPARPYSERASNAGEGARPPGTRYQLGFTRPLACTIFARQGRSSCCLGGLASPPAPEYRSRRFPCGASRMSPSHLPPRRILDCARPRSSRGPSERCRQSRAPLVAM